MCIPESYRVTVIQTDFGQWPTWDSSRTDLLYLGIPTNRLALPGTPHTGPKPVRQLLFALPLASLLCLFRALLGPKMSQDGEATPK